MNPEPPVFLKTQEVGRKKYTELALSRFRPDVLGHRCIHRAELGRSPAWTLLWEGVSEVFSHFVPDDCLCVDTLCLLWLRNRLDFGGGMYS